MKKILLGISLIFFLGMLADAQTNDSDYYRDGEILMLNVHTKGKGVAIVIVGDGFDREDLRKGGWYEQTVRSVADVFFKVPVIRDFKEYFDFYAYMAESPVRGVGQGVKNKFGGDPFKAQAAVDAVPGMPATRTTIFAGNGMVGGHAWYGGPVLFSTDEGANLYWASHELAGHGFSRLGDEYYSPSKADDGYRESIKRSQTETSSDLNVDITDDPEQMIWKNFFGRPGYEAVGIFEGASYHSEGMWRAEKQSVMVGWIPEYKEKGPHFTAQARYNIYCAIMRKAEEPHSFDDFLKYDVVNLKNVKPLPESKIKDPSLSVDSTRILAKRIAGTYSLKIKSNTVWTATVEPNSASWCSISATEGKGNSTLKVKVVENAQGAVARSGYIFVRSGEKLIVVRIAQDGIWLDAPKDPIQISLAGDYYVDISSNTAWTLEKDVDWIEKISPLSGNAGKTTLTVTVKKQGALTPKGQIKIKAGKIEKEIKFEQTIGILFSTGTGRGRNRRILNLYETNLIDNQQIAGKPDDIGLYFRYFDPEAYSPGGKWNKDTTRNTGSDWMFNSAPPSPKGFRVPTVEEFTRLFNSYNVVWRDGNSGFGNAIGGIFVGANCINASISDLKGCMFLPAAGYIDESGTLQNKGVAGYYRVAENGGDTLFYFDKTNPTPTPTVVKNSRLWGASIRCVLF
ncbi:MAG: BACON domain-containing protein [Prevotellaceae bacterium]|nr:BACON domain-containing protein [Prevotellaceae bacterium]